MCFAMSCCLSIWYKGSVLRLKENEKTKSVEMGRLFLRCYGALAADAQASQELLWKLRPKLHYFEHCLDECLLKGSNPLQQSNFIDEDSMKHLRGVAMSCHPSTVKVTWARRYLLKQVLLYRRMKSIGSSAWKRTIVSEGNFAVFVWCWFVHICVCFLMFLQFKHKVKHK